MCDHNPKSRVIQIRGISEMTNVVDKLTREVNEMVSKKMELQLQIRVKPPPRWMPKKAWAWIVKHVLVMERVMPKLGE